MSIRWPAGARRRGGRGVTMLSMQTRFVDGLTIRPLHDGDTETVARLFDRLGAGSRERRFCGAKPRLTERELAQLARVDGARHVLVG